MMMMMIVFLLVGWVEIVSRACRPTRIVLRVCEANVVTRGMGRVAVVPGGSTVINQNDNLGVVLCRNPCTLEDETDGNVYSINTAKIIQ